MEHQWYSAIFLVITLIIHARLYYYLFMHIDKYKYIQLLFTSGDYGQILSLIQNKLILMIHIMFLCICIILQPIIDTVTRGSICTVYGFYIFTIFFHMNKVILEQNRLHNIVENKDINTKNVLKIEGFSVVLIILWMTAAAIILSTIEDKVMLFVGSNTLIAMCFLTSICIQILTFKVKSRKLSVDFSFTNYMFVLQFIMTIASVFQYLYGPFSAIIVYALCLISIPIYLCEYIYDFGVNLDIDEESNEIYNTILEMDEPLKLIKEKKEILHMFLRYCRKREKFPIKAKNKNVIIDPSKIVLTISLIDNLICKYNDNINSETLNNILMFICEQNGVYMTKDCLNEITETLNEKKYKEVMDYIMKDMIDTLLTKFGRRYMLNEFIKTKYWLSIKEDIHPQFRYNDAELDISMEKKLMDLKKFSLTDNLFKIYIGYRGLQTEQEPEIITLE